MDERKTFEPVAESARAARRFVATVLDAAGATADTLERAILLVSELATNAVLHGRTEFEVGVVLLPGRVHVEVADMNPRMPIQSMSSASATTGRGLSLVQTVADDWGVETRSPGKVVWFDLHA